MNVCVIYITTHTQTINQNQSEKGFFVGKTLFIINSVEKSKP